VGIASEAGAAIWPCPADGLLWDANADPVTFEVLGRLPGAQQTRPFDLNELNQVVGTSIDPDFDDQRAVLWHSGTLYDLNALIPADSGWTLLVANAINDAGWIVDYGRRAGVPGRRAFLLKPAVIFAEDFEDGHLGEWAWTEP
jgi:hypothetical protein